MISADLWTALQCDVPRLYGAGAGGQVYQRHGDQSVQAGRGVSLQQIFFPSHITLTCCVLGQELFVSAGHSVASMASCSTH